MCGIAGIHDLNRRPVTGLRGSLRFMSEMLAHRGPDDQGAWTSDDASTGLAHRRLSIIDLSAAARQPMCAESGAVLVFNGEIYNYRELRSALASGWSFRSASDTEAILAAYERYGIGCLERLRGMFAFALWDGERLLCARDPFGIKPFYYAVVDEVLLFASEAKALLAFLPEIATDRRALAEYLTFQHPISERTLFRGIRQLPPGHYLVADDGGVRVSRYWDIDYDVDVDREPGYFERRLRDLLDDSIDLHLRSDVPIGYHLSGGLDSSLIAVLARRHDDANRLAFHGKFVRLSGYDESAYARAAARAGDCDLHEIEITAADFVDEIGRVVYHLDYPIAGPGSFAQFMVSKLAREHTKVVLGGQGGDEIFGGYARYLIAYFEQCIKAAIDGTYKDGNFVVTIESIVPNLGVLREYKPLIARFWRDGLFDDLDARYFRLIDRSAGLRDCVDWDSLGEQGIYDDFRSIFNNRANVRHQAYFDSMTHFDFKCLLPALLHVEDRVSMAHGLESRVPFLDVPLIELMARVPADVKFAGGEMKRLLKTAYADVLPEAILQRRDKMGFPVPLTEWVDGPIAGLVHDLLESSAVASRPYLQADAARRVNASSAHSGRDLWALLSLELWYQTFHDRAAEYRERLREARDRAVTESSRDGSRSPDDPRVTEGMQP